MDEYEKFYNWRLGNGTLRQMKADKKLIREQKEIIEYQRRRIHILEKKLWGIK